MADLQAADVAALLKALRPVRERTRRLDDEVMLTVQRWADEDGWKFGDRSPAERSFLLRLARSIIDADITDAFRSSE